MKKQFFALLCAASLLLGLASPALALEGEAVRAADTLYTLGLLTDTEYAVKQAASRLSAVSLVVKLSGLNVAGSGDEVRNSGIRFGDLPEESADVVKFAAYKGWVNGTAADTFSPNTPITANAWFTMLLRMLGYSDQNGDFTASQAAVFARRIGMTSMNYVGTLNRGQMLESAKEALIFPYKDGSGTMLSHLVSAGTVNESVANALGLNTPELTARQAADRHMAAVFMMTLYENQEEVDAGEASAEASGFFITPDGIAVTNYHSIDGSVKAVATLVTGEMFEVSRVLWYDVEMDLAVIRVSKSSTTGRNTSAFAYLEPVDTEDVRPGDVVYTLSNPLGLGLAVSSGVVSAVGREVERYALPCIMNTADISVGSSGGALLNVFGQVIAVTSGAYVVGNNMYLAVPIDTILTLDLSTAPGKTLSEVMTEHAAKGERDMSEQSD